jgi:hypothetical protein
MLYSSVLSPESLEKTAAASSMTLQTQVAKMLDSITCTTIPREMHQWYNDILTSVQKSSKRLWGDEIKVPKCLFQFRQFISIGMKNLY